MNYVLYTMIINDDITTTIKKIKNMQKNVNFIISKISFVRLCMKIIQNMYKKNIDQNSR